MSINKFSNFEVEHVPDDEIGLGMADYIENIKDNSDNDKTDENINDNSDSDSNPDWNPYEDKELMAKIGYLKSDDSDIEISDNDNKSAVKINDKADAEQTTEEHKEFTPSKVSWGNVISLQEGKENKCDYYFVDSFNFAAANIARKSFVEFLIEPKYVHLYFDIDDITNVEDYEEFKQWLDSLVPIFGNYSIGGYSSNEEFAEQYGFRYYDETDKILSAHIVFYTTRIKAVELSDLMIYNHVHKFCDRNVYKLRSRQAWRHVLSNKVCYDKNLKETIRKQNHGKILNNLKPSTQLITPRGDERIVTKEEWIKVFPAKTEEELSKEKEDKKKKDNKKSKKTKDKVDNDKTDDNKSNDKTDDNNIDNENTEKKTKSRSKTKSISKYTVEDLDYDEKIIELSIDELVKLLDNFESHNYDLIHTIAPLYNSPLSKEDIVEAVKTWYDKTEHKTPDDIESIVDKYYHYEHSNKWLFVLIKQISNKQIKRKYYNQYFKVVVDVTANINNSEICYRDIINTRYNMCELPLLITHLKGCVGSCHGEYYMKEMINGQYVISKRSKDKFHDELGLYKPFKHNNIISLCHIFKKFSNYFIYDDIKLSKENIPNVINYFQGYKHKEIITDDFTILEPLLEHVKHIVCNDDEKKYEYIMNWFANIVQNLNVKNGTLPIIHGAQGSGKSCFAELMCELLGNLALYNNDDLDKVFGKFNSISDGKVLIVLNETAEADEKFSYSEKLKSRITQIHTIYESKGVDQRAGYNYANYIMTSNNANPIRAQKGDRRTIYFPTNNQKIGDRTYFKNLHSKFQPKKQGDYNSEYMGVLLHYMLTQFHPEDYDFEELIFEINNNTNTDFNESLERQYNDLNGIEQYIVDNSLEFKIGFSRLQSIKLPGFPQKSIIKILNKYCNTKRIRRNGKEIKDIQDKLLKYKNSNDEGYTDIFGLYMEGNRSSITIYRLKDEKEIPDFYNIIKYKEYQQDHEEQEQEE